MFSVAFGNCLSNQDNKIKVRFGESIEVSLRPSWILLAVDIISGIALVTIGILAAISIIPMGSAFSHAMIGVGGFQLFPLLYYFLATVTKSLTPNACIKEEHTISGPRNLQHLQGF